MVGLKSDGTVVVGGYNSYGQCSVEGWTLNQTFPVPPPSPAPGIVEVVPKRKRRTSFLTITLPLSLRVQIYRDEAIPEIAALRCQ